MQLMMICMWKEVRGFEMPMWELVYRSGVGIGYWEWIERCLQYGDA